ncbi:choice-of-anchor L domain-containing protein [Bizionia sediminis]|uniref:Choice-of-anchor L domain-containing protein n=1 Tax=Bizionia sediminis TaxID=1737064 RepID=A0ABW5KR79_9FLAO
MKYALFFTCLFLASNSFSQQISIDDSLPVQQLIEERLISGCVEISNVQSAVNGSVNNINSFGYFERGNSAFPFQNGILLSTGAAVSAGNTTNSNPLNDGDLNWGTDNDLETILGITNTLNATTIEFDFISVSNQIQFNYILASEEYFDNYPCIYSDGFAFLIREAGSTDPYVNIAVVPGTNVPVNTSTIHPEILGFCPADNEAYFEGYSLGDTNFNGRTTVLTAAATIQPNVPYQIKLIIADQTDQNFDSAVFIEGNSFNASVDLGPDVTTCADNLILDGDIQNPLATYVWLDNNAPIPGETSPTLTVTESGTYTVSVSIPLNNTICTIEDTINVTLNSEQAAEAIPDFEVCDDPTNDGIYTVDVSVMDAAVLAAVPPGNYTISYHFNSTNAQDGSFPITAPFQNSSNPQTIFVRILDINTGCLAFGSFNILVNPVPNITPPDPLEVCDDGNGDGMTQIDLSANNNTITGGNPDYTVSYHFNQTDADTGANPIEMPYTNSSQTDTVFIRVVNALTGCVTTTTQEITVLEGPQINNETQVIDACEQDEDGFETFDLSSVISDVLNSLNNVTTSFHITYEDAQTGANPIEDITNYTNTTPQLQVVYIRVVDNLTGCPAIASIELHANFLTNSTNIRDFAVCDDESNDGIADFNLENIATTISNGLEDTTVTFFENETDQLNNENALDASILYQVTNAPQTLYVTVANLDCSINSEIALLIDPATILNPLPATTYCDTDTDTFASIDMSSFNSFVSGSIPNATVSYFETEQNALDNTNPLPPFYNNTSNPVTVFVRVTNSVTGCFDVENLEILVLPAPETNQPTNAIICDDDQDGMTRLNLESKISEIVSNTTDLNLSFYNSLADAENDTNPINNTTNYNSGTETIFIRIERISTGCFSVESFDVIVNTLPVFTSISDFNDCETDGNQIGAFIFQDKDAEILNNQVGKRVLYFETPEDALNRTNSIDKTSVYENTSNPQRIHVRVENITDTACFGVSSFLIEVGSLPIFTPPTDTFLCDDISNDGQETFNLTAIQDQMSLNSPENLTITFYDSLENATNAINALPLNYTNQNNPQQIYTRIENGTFCYGIAEFGLNVIQVPRVNQASEMVQCDSDNDGSTSFNLTVAELEVLNIRQNDILVTYHENIADLEANTNNIPNPEAYNNIENPQTVYIRVTNTVSACYVSVPLNLRVNVPPTINPINAYPVCETPNNTVNLLDTYETFIGNQPNVNLNFFATETDAQNNENALNTTYNYSSNSDIIYIRAENTQTGCFATSSFVLTVNQNPIANTPPNMEACDTDFDGMLIFDLSQQTRSILGSQNAANFTVSYFELEIEALENNNPIANLNYNAFNEQTIYVRVQNNATGCFSTTSFLTLVQRKPFVQIPDQTVCLDNLPLVVSADTGFETDTYLWSTGARTSEIEITEIGMYSVTVTTDYGCTTTATFNVIESEQATIEFTETVDFSDPNNITVTISGIGNYLYILDNGVPQQSNIFYNVSLGPHTIEVIDLNGCASAIKELVIIDAPRFFTPNQDGQNDTWHITGVDQIPGTIVYIFNRYGKLLTTLNHTSVGWDGTYKGQNMPTDDYWFLAQVKKGDIAFEVKRNFTLKR